MKGEKNGEMSHVLNEAPVLASSGYGAPIVLRVDRSLSCDGGKSGDDGQVLLRALLCATSVLGGAMYVVCRMVYGLTFGSILKIWTGAVRPPINSSSSRIRRMKAYLIGFATRYHTMPCISRRSSTSVGRAVPRGSTLAFALKKVPP